MEMKFALYREIIGDQVHSSNRKMIALANTMDELEDIACGLNQPAVRWSIEDAATGKTLDRS